MKFKVFKIQFLIILFFLSFSSFAQIGEISESYVILNNGIEVKGKVEGKFDVETYSEIEFISNAGVKTTYQPGEIQEFGLGNGRFFKSEIIPLQVQPVFVQVLVSGSIDLYKWNNKYFITREGHILELKVIQSTKTENGKIVNVNTNQYLGVLTLAMNDECGASLKDDIEKTKLTDRELIDMFTKYYSCKNIAYEIHASQVPFSKLSFRAQVGISLIGITEHQSSQNLDYSLGQTSSPYLEVGVRFSDFRNAPRLLVDIGLGYLQESNTLLLEGELRTFDLTGSEKYKSSSFLVPIHLSYIVFKQNRNKIYTGLGLTFWETKFDAEVGELIVDNEETIPNVISSNFITRKEMGLSPNIKVGYSNELSDKMRLFVELKGDLLVKNMSFYPLTYNAIYNYVVGTLSVGVEL